MIKILSITEEGRYGGPQKRICEVAEQLKSYPIDIEVLCPSNNSKVFLDQLSRSNVKYTSIKIHRLTRDLKHLLGYILNFIPETIKIYRIIKRQGFSIVHCNGSWQFKGLIASKIAGVKNVWHMNDTYLPGFVQGFYKLIYFFFSDRYFIFASHRTKEYYFPGNRIEKLKLFSYIPAPVDTSYFDPKSVLSTCPYPDPDYTGFRVLTVGNVNPGKNHELFIEIADDLNRMYPEIEARFYIAGKINTNHIPLYKRLRAYLESNSIGNVFFLDGRTDIRELLHFSDVYACCSKREASPMAVWEAMAMGKPILSTDVGDVKEVFKEYDCGIVGDMNSPQTMAKKLQKVLTDPHLKESLGKNAREAAIRNLDIKICAQRHKDFYHKVFQHS